METIDLLIVVLYLSMVFSLGLFFSRRQKSTEDYFLAARSMPGWVVGFSLMGTVVSSVTFVGHPGNVFTSDFWHLVFYLPLPLGLLLVTRILVFYRHTLRMSAYEYLGTRFGYPTQAYASFAFGMSRILDMSLTFYFLAIAIAYLTDWDIWWVILGIGLGTLLYTLVGGIGAVVWTDVIQAVLLVGGGIVCLLTVLFTLPEGASQILSTAWQGGKFSWGNWEFSLLQNNVWLYLIAGSIWTVQNFCTNQNMVQRYLLARSDREAKRAAVAGISACLPVWLIFMFLGACLWGFYELGTDSMPAEVMAVKDNILPYFIKSYLPHGIIGVMLAALMAAAMSSLDSDLNSVGAVVVQNFYRPLWPESTDSQQLLMGRVVVVVAGVSSIVMAKQWIGIESLVEFGVSLTAIFSGGVVGLFGLGFLFRRATARGAYVGIFACVLFTAWATLTSIRLPNMESPLLDLGSCNYTGVPLLIGILGHVVLVSLGLATSFLTKPKDRTVA